MQDSDIAKGDPRTPPQYRFVEMSADDFEALVFRVAWAEDHGVVRLKAPDGGLDTLLPDPQSPADIARGWQAKRYSGAVNWKECEDSLDRAVATWALPQVTFVFPRNLSGNEHTSFITRLVGRHTDVTVDYWGKDALDARLDSTEGQRIAAWFFDEQDPIELAERMLNAGSPVTTGGDMLDAEFAIGDAISAAHPDFDWVIHRAPADRVPPAPTSDVLLRLAFHHQNAVVHADLVPRHTDAGPLPALSVRLDDSPAGRDARRWLDQLMRSPGGGRLALRDGIKVALANVPAPFGDMFGDAVFDGELTVRAVAEPLPFFANLVAVKNDAATSVEIDLFPVAPPDDWDAVLKGRVGGLSAALRFRWFVEQSRGESNLTFNYADIGAPHEIEARVLRWLAASYESTSIRLEDRNGDRPTLIQAAKPSRAPSWLEAWAELHADLAELEQAAGAAAPPIPPGDLSSNQVNAVATVASMLRARHSIVPVSESTMDFKASAVPRIEGVVNALEMRATLVADVFGQEMPVARQVFAFPPMVVRDRQPLATGGWRLVLVPLGGHSAEVISELIPLVEDPH